MCGATLVDRSPAEAEPDFFGRPWLDAPDEWLAPLAVFNARRRRAFDVAGGDIRREAEGLAFDAPPKAAHSTIL